MARGTPCILITAGPTREYLDPVRFISNPSTGLMGYLIAEACLARGWKVVLISGPTHLSPPHRARLVRVETSAQMKEAVLQNLPRCDALVMAAAVTDWRPAVKHRQKLKRKERWLLPLVPTADILAEAARRRTAGQFLVGFALETGGIRSRGRKKLLEKGVDCVIANTPAFFGTGQPASAAVIQPSSIQFFHRTTKRQVAYRVAGIIAKHLDSRQRG